MPLSVERQIKVELWAQEMGQMERAVSLGHSITQNMFVCSQMCLLKWDVLSSVSKYSRCSYLCIVPGLHGCFRVGLQRLTDTDMRRKRVSISNRSSQFLLCALTLGTERWHLYHHSNAKR